MRTYRVLMTYEITVEAESEEEAENKLLVQHEYDGVLYELYGAVEDWYTDTEEL